MSLSSVPGRLIIFIAAIIAFRKLLLQRELRIGVEDLRENNLDNSIVLDVYIESLCIDSKRFILDQLIPVYQALGSSVVKLNLVIFGNAQISTLDNAIIQCQHGEAECDANR